MTAHKKTTGKPPTSGRAGKPIRLQKILASAGIDSRRGCEELILSGAVTVNGEVVHTLPAFANPETDDIRVEGSRIRPERKVYFLLNKPKNVICTNRDPQGRPKAIDLAPCQERVFCVGRLDVETTGLILLTNDAELANRLTHPRYELPKTYEVTVRGRLDGEAIEKLKKGVWLSEGKTERAAVRVLRRTHVETILEISIRQGLNRQVRRSFARLGYKVKALKRTRIGDIELKGIPAGQCKKLSGAQLAYLRRAGGLKNGEQKPAHAANHTKKK